MGEGKGLCSIFPLPLLPPVLIGLRGPVDHQVGGPTIRDLREGALNTISTPDEGQKNSFSEWGSICKLPS